MTRHVAFDVAVALVALGLALAAGPARRPALVGLGLSTLGAALSLAGFSVGCRGAGRLMNRALAVVVVMFLVRLVLVAVGTVAVARAGDSVLAFVVAFFVPYFIFAMVEAGYVHALGRTGRTA